MSVRVGLVRGGRGPISVPDLMSDGAVLMSDEMNGCLDVSIGRCERVPEPPSGEPPHQ